MEAGEKKKEKGAISDKHRGPPGFVSLVYHHFIAARDYLVALDVNLHFLTSCVASVAFAGGSRSTEGQGEKVTRLNASKLETRGDATGLRVCPLLFYDLPKRGREKRRGTISKRSVTGPGFIAWPRLT